MAHLRGPDPNTRPPDLQDHPDALQRLVSWTCQGVPGTSTACSDTTPTIACLQCTNPPPATCQHLRSSVCTHRCELHSPELVPLRHSAPIRRPAARQHHQCTLLRASLASTCRSATEHQSAAQRPANTTSSHCCEHYSPALVPSVSHRVPGDPSGSTGDHHSCENHSPVVMSRCPMTSTTSATHVPAVRSHRVVSDRVTAGHVSPDSFNSHRLSCRRVRAEVCGDVSVPHTPRRTSTLVW